MIAGLLMLKGLLKKYLGVIFSDILHNVQGK